MMLSEEQQKYKKLYETEQDRLEKAKKGYSTAKERADSLELFLEKYNEVEVEEEAEKTDEEIEEELTGQTKKGISDRWAAQQRITKDFNEGYAKDYKEEREILRQTDPDKMSTIQLIAEGHRQRDEKRKKEEEETTTTIDFNQE